MTNISMEYIILRLLRMMNSILYLGVWGGATYLWARGNWEVQNPSKDASKRHFSLMDGKENIFFIEKGLAKHAYQERSIIL